MKSKIFLLLIFVHTISGIGILYAQPQIIIREHFDSAWFSGYTIIANGTDSDTTSLTSRSGNWAVVLAGSNGMDADPYILFDNIDVSGYDSLSIEIAFAAMGPDSDDDLWLELSYDNGVTWSAQNAVKLIDGYGNATIDWDSVSVSNPTTVQQNPYTITLSGFILQVQIRIRFDEKSGSNNTNDFYYIDDIKVSGVPKTTYDKLILEESFCETTFPPPDWVGNGVSRSTTTTAYYSPPAAASFGATNGYLLLPSLSFVNKVTFRLGRTTNTSPKTFQIEASVNGPSGPFQIVDSLSNDDVPAASYNLYIVDLSAFSCYPNVWIRFSKVSSTTSAWRLDDINVYQTVVLPVTWSYYYGIREGSDALLYWGTASEINNSHFVIMKWDTQSADFYTTGTVHGAGNTNSTWHYNYRDETSSEEKSWYRIDQVDIDGTHTTGPIIKMDHVPKICPEIIAVNTSNYNIIKVITTNLSKGRYNLTILDSKGIIHYNNAVTGKNEIEIKLNNNLSAGIYVLRLGNENIIKSHKFLVCPNFK